MATDKKHIAVYLDKAVEDALSKFCTDNGLESKKGLMYSAAVNKALAQFFGVESSTPSTTPGNTPGNTASDIPDSLDQRIAEIVERKMSGAIEQLRTELGELAA
ncbi:hypothetical protein QUA00_32325 [Microcoleus sp. T2B6]|uniref:hypothetical protein n=1 Tax=Microcoleus sp. T2B6 TaxID=3055424 RepID=UPI002FD61D64